MGSVKKFAKFIVVFAVIFSWIFGGWPQVFEFKNKNLEFNFPPKVQKAQAAFTSRTETTADSSSQSSPYNLSINTPGGVIDGDIMFLWAGLNASTIDSIDAAWASLGSYTTNNDKYYLYYKIASSEPASYTISAAASGRIRLVMTAYSAGDWNSGDPIDIVSNTAYRTSSSVARAASMNVSAVNSPLIFFGALYNTSNNSWTKPANIGSDVWVDDYDSRNSTSDFSLQIASMIWSGSGATGNIDATNSLTSQTTKHAFAVALNPPPAPSITAPSSVQMPDYTLGGVGYSERNFQDVSALVQVTANVGFTVTVSSTALTGTNNTIAASSVKLKTDGTVSTNPTVITNCTGFSGITETSTGEYSLNFAQTIVTTTSGSGTCDIYPTLRVYISGSPYIEQDTGTLTFTVF